MKTIVIGWVIGLSTAAFSGPGLGEILTPKSDERIQHHPELDSLRTEVKVLRAEIAKLRAEAAGTSEKKDRDYGDIDGRIEMLKTPTGVEFGLFGNKPSAPTATVFWFGGSIALSGVEIVPFLIDHDYLCVTLDSPSHGRDLEPGEPRGGIEGWRYRVENKRNFVREFNEKVSQVLDYLITERYTDSDRLAVVGGSRGAFLAFHYAASDPRVKCVAGQIPVTELRALDEFKGMENDPLTKSLSVINLAENFSGHKVLVIIGDGDGRVGTDHAIAFARRVSMVARDVKVKLHVLPGGHFAMEGLTELSNMWLSKHLSPKESPK